MPKPKAKKTSTLSVLATVIRGPAKALEAVEIFTNLTDKLLGSNSGRAESQENAPVKAANQLEEKEILQALDTLEDSFVKQEIAGAASKEENKHQLSSVAKLAIQSADGMIMHTKQEIEQALRDATNLGKQLQPLKQRFNDCLQQENSVEAIKTLREIKSSADQISSNSEKICQQLSPLLDYVTEQQKEIDKELKELNAFQLSIPPYQETLARKLNLPPKLDEMWKSWEDRKETTKSWFTWASDTAYQLWTGNTREDVLYAELATFASKKIDAKKKEGDTLKDDYEKLTNAISTLQVASNVSKQCVTLVTHIEKDDSLAVKNPQIAKLLNTLDTCIDSQSKCAEACFGLGKLLVDTKYLLAMQALKRKLIADNDATALQAFKNETASTSRLKSRKIKAKVKEALTGVNISSPTASVARLGG